LAAHGIPQKGQQAAFLETSGWKAYFPDVRLESLTYFPDVRLESLTYG
jgi:hypothetical protein